MKDRTRKQQWEQDEAGNISSPSPALCGALLCCLPGEVGKDLGTEGFDFSEVAKPSLCLGQPLAPHGNARGFQPRQSEVWDVTAPCFSVPQFPPAVERR